MKQAPPGYSRAAIDHLAHETAKEVPVVIFRGVGFHARQRIICYCDTADGEIQLRVLGHEGDDVRDFYSTFTSEVIVGVEADGYGTWFVELVEGLGYRLLIGDASEVRRLAKRGQKNNRATSDPLDSGQLCLRNLLRQVSWRLQSLGDNRLPPPPQQPSGAIRRRKI
jgi:hypothetical protein